MQKIKDLVVSTGTYVDNQGQTKHRYKNVGSMMQNENGVFLILDRTFNPAGLPNPDNKEGCFVSCFDIKERSKQPQYQSQPSQTPQNQPQPAQNSNNSDQPFVDSDLDSIPF